MVKDQETENNIHDDGDPRKYRTELPNLIDDMDLSVYAFRLYVHLKRVAGAGGGSCWQGTRTLATACKMSVGKVAEAKQELAAAGLIVIGERQVKDNMVHDITIINIWRKNLDHFDRPQEGGGVHHMNTGVHHMNERSNQYKKEPIKTADVPIAISREEGGNGPPPPNPSLPNGEKATVLDALQRVNEAIIERQLGQPITGIKSMVMPLIQRGETFETVRLAWQACKAGATSPVGAFMKWVKEGYLPQRTDVTNGSNPEENYRYNEQAGRWERFNFGMGWGECPVGVVPRRLLLTQIVQDVRLGRAG